MGKKQDEEDDFEWQCRLLVVILAADVYHSYFVL